MHRPEIVARDCWQLWRRHHPKNPTFGHMDWRRCSVLPAAKIVAIGTRHIKKNGPATEQSAARGEEEG